MEMKCISVMKYFKKMDIQAVNGKPFPVHCREFYLERIRFVERPLYATPLEVANVYRSINAGLCYESDLLECVCYFSNNNHTKTTRHFHNHNLITSPCERLQHLALYCLYNGGLVNLSVQDLSYIYSFIS